MNCKIFKVAKNFLFKDQALACKQLWVSLLLSITTIKFYLRTVAMTTVLTKHVRHIGRHVGFFKNFILRKSAATVTEISRKHVIEYKEY